MEFRILGPFEVRGPAGPVDVRGAKRRGLLACLVVHAGQPMSTDPLVEELWGDRGSDGAARTVQTYVSQLRKLLRDEAANLVETNTPVRSRARNYRPSPSGCRGPSWCRTVGGVVIRWIAGGHK
jgi:DNA-binding SARP family transcriptional activator